MGALLTITDIERIYGSPLLEDFYSELGYMMIVSIQYPSSYYQPVLFYPTLDIYYDLESCQTRKLCFVCIPKCLAL